MNSAEDILHSSAIAPSATEHHEPPKAGSPDRPCQDGDSDECRSADWPQQKGRPLEDVESAFNPLETSLFRHVLIPLYCILIDYDKFIIDVYHVLIIVLIFEYIILSL